MTIFSVRLNKEEERILKELADAMDLTRSDVVRMALKLLHVVVMSKEPIEKKHKLIEKLSNSYALQKEEIKLV